MSRGFGEGRHVRQMVFGVLNASMIVFALANIQALAQTTQPAKVILYAASGRELIHFDVEPANATLIQRGSVMLPTNVQEGWPHPSKPILYVTWSDRLERGTHGLTAFAIDPSTGVLRPHGPALRLAERSIHVTTDIPGKHVLVAYNDPPGLTVHRIEADGSLGSEVTPASPLKLGVYPHHVRVDLSNKSVIVPSRGWAASAQQPEVPGQIDVFAYEDGVLAKRGVVAPNGGIDFQVRHLDFHPTRPFAFLTLERQNKLLVFQRTADGMLGARPLFSKDTLIKAGSAGAAASVHVHPNGRFVYTSNRGSRNEGENSIAVFQINQETGEPTRIQNADTRGLSPRTFGIDPAGRLLVVANESAGSVREGTTPQPIPTSLAVFRIQGDGKLEYVRKYDVSTDSNTLLRWMVIVQVP